MLYRKPTYIARLHIMNTLSAASDYNDQSHPFEDFVRWMTWPRDDSCNWWKSLKNSTILAQLKICIGKWRHIKSEISKENIFCSAGFPHWATQIHFTSFWPKTDEWTGKETVWFNSLHRIKNLNWLIIDWKRFWRHEKFWPATPMLVVHWQDNN